MFAEVSVGAVVGLVGGVAASWVCWRYLLHLKPKLVLSSQIACQPTTAGEEDRVRSGAWRYQVKVANRGRRQVVNLRVECQLAGRKPIPGGFMRTVTRMPVKASTHAVLGPAAKPGSPFGITPVWHVVVYSDDDLRETLSQDERVLVTLLATDALTGTTVAYRREYDPRAIVEGQFPFGLYVDVIPVGDVPAPAELPEQASAPEEPAAAEVPAMPDLPGQREAVGP
jgi:hypothetical protein